MPTEKYRTWENWSVMEGQELKTFSRKSGNVDRMNVAEGGGEYLCHCVKLTRTSMRIPSVWGDSDSIWTICVRFPAITEASLLSLLYQNHLSVVLFKLLEIRTSIICEIQADFRPIAVAWIIFSHTFSLQHIYWIPEISTSLDIGAASNPTDRPTLAFLAQD